MNTSKINEMKLAALRPHRKYESAIFVRTSIEVTSTQVTEMGDIEILTVKVGNCAVTSSNKLPNSTFAFKKPSNFDTKNKHIIIGDSNSHYTS